MRKRFFMGLNDERGVAALEFAFVLPVLMLIAFGVIDLARAVWTQSTLDYAVQAAARCGAVNSTTCSTAAAIKSYAVTQTYGLNGVAPSNFPTVTIPPATPCGGLKGVQVTGTYLFTYYFPPFATFNPATFTAAACYPT